MMAIYLMGHGLVALPRKLFQDANISKRLQRLYSQAPRVKDRLDDARFELEELEAQLAQLRRRKNAVSRDHEEWIEELIKGSPRINHRSSSTMQAAALPAVLTDRYLAEFSRKLMRARHKEGRFFETWHQLVRNAAEVKAVVEASTTKKLTFTTQNGSPGFWSNFRTMTPYTRYLIHVRALPLVRMAGGAILAIGSICIVWSEFIKNLAPQLSIVSLTVLSYNDKTSKITFGGQVVASIWLLYMSVAALASFEDVKIWGNRALVKRNTYGESAAWYSAQIAKLTVPLTYNFITFLPDKIYQSTQYFKFLGTLINLTPLGKYFDFFFPIFILVPVCITLFRLYGRVKHMFGFGVIDDNDESDLGGWRNGRDLIDRELNDEANSSLVHRLDGASSPRRLASRINSDAQAGPAWEGTPPSSRPNIGRQTTSGQRQAQRLAEATAAAEEEDESFFQGFAHRVKNTIDSVERPGWMNELGKRPRWMGNSGGENSNSPGSGRGFSRWFGGTSDGEIRL